MLRRSLAVPVLALLPLAACGDDGPDYAGFCEQYRSAGGDVEVRTSEGTEQLEYFGTQEHIDDLTRIQQAVPESDERLTEAMATFVDWVETDYEPTPGAQNPGSWPGEIRVAYDRLTGTARDEC